MSHIWLDSFQALTGLPSTWNDSCECLFYVLPKKVSWLVMLFHSLHSLQSYQHCRGLCGPSDEC